MTTEREEQLRSIEARITALKTAPEVLDLETRRLEKEARTRLADLNGLLRRNPTEARAAMEALLVGLLVFTPTTTAEGKRYRIEGHAALDYVFPMKGVPSGIRTRVTALKGLGPGPG